MLFSEIRRLDFRLVIREFHHDVWIMNTKEEISKEYVFLKNMSEQ